jgi:exopolysaccharide biosynthesis polyprenyl glycosylphosphotransferase
VGFLSGDEEPHALDDDLAHIAVLGTVDDAPSLVSLLDVERVIIAFVEVPYQQLLELVRTLNSFDVQVDIVPRLHDVLSPAVDVHTVEGVPLVGLRPPELSSSSALLKRALDFFVSLVALLILAPVLVVVALSVKLDSRGPVLFGQTRVGRGGRPFRILKFRTMVADAETLKSQVAHLNRHLRDGDARMFKITDDPRTTRVGRVLRRFSLDELPQLWNVVRGDMSLVGPRPLILAEDVHVGEWARRRLDLRPGMTGLWQVLGRDGIPFEEMVRLDYLYITTWSLGNDIRLMLRTLPIVLAGSAS